MHTVKPTTYGVPGAVTRAHVDSSPRCSTARRAWCTYVRTCADMCTAHVHAVCMLRRALRTPEEDSLASSLTC